MIPIGRVCGIEIQSINIASQWATNIFVTNAVLGAMLRILHILLIVQTFVGSSGVLLNRHYCMGRLMDTALYAEAVSCFDYFKDEPREPLRANGELDRPDCCDERTTYSQEVSDYPATDADLTVSALLPPSPLSLAALRRPAADRRLTAPGRAPPLLRSHLLLAWRQVFQV